MRGHLEEDADAARSFHYGRPGGAAFGAAGQRSGDPGFSFHAIAKWASNALGTPVAFASACGLVVLWLVAGPIFNYSDSWQLVINTGTTIATFLMVFLVQNTQNRALARFTSSSMNSCAASSLRGMRSSTSKSALMKKWRFSSSSSRSCA